MGLDTGTHVVSIFGHGERPWKWVLQSWFWCNTINISIAKKNSPVQDRQHRYYKKIQPKKNSKAWEQGTK
jgi:hypothetical protein